MRLSLSTSGLLDPRQFATWSSEQQRAVHTAVAKGMRSGGREVRDAARAALRSAFHVKRNRFLSSMSTKVFDKKPEQLPALWVGSKIPWLGLHEKGGTISGNLLIPLLPGRIGPKRFKAIIEELMHSGNAFFIKKNGHLLLMAENLKENTRQLSPFKRAERARSGVKQIKRGQIIPIAVLVKRVDLKRRLNLSGSVQRALPALARAIQDELDG